jgi:DNA-binding NtrC family response regulator
VNERILIVDDDKAFRIATVALLEDNSHTVSVATNAEEAKEMLSSGLFDLVLSDVVMEGMNGIELLQWIKSQRPDMPVMMITGFGSINTAVEAMRLGAYDYIAKPCDNDELLIKIRRALENRRKDRELQRLREEVQEKFRFGNIISRNEKMKRVFKLVQQVAETDVTVLILGETGTGKEMLAKAIHYNSVRREKPFVVITCSALSETLLESELFGHERGAFTGAQRQRIGKFEDANGGTVFLDEIGDVPVHLQTKLLRVLQEKEIERVGGNRPIKVDVRIVAATNKDLDQLTEQGSFREDLFYRLNVFPLHLPPLRDRHDDIALLVDHLLQKFADISGGRVKRISPGALATMMKHNWPGNIREMENVIKRAIIKTEADIITDIDLPEARSGTPAADSPSLLGPEVPFKDYMKNIVQDAELKYLTEMLERHQGNIKMVAELMDLDRKTVYRKIQELGIDLAKYRGSEPSS